MAVDVKKRTTTLDSIKTQLSNGAYTFAVRDAGGRMIEFYEAPIWVRDGDPCLKTSFKYVDGPLGTSRDVLATKEEIEEWRNIC